MLHVLSMRLTRLKAGMWCVLWPDLSPVFPSLPSPPPPVSMFSTDLWRVNTILHIVVCSTHTFADRRLPADFVHSQVS